MKKRLLLVIIAYNCEGRIIKTLESIDKPILNYVTNVLVINTNSTDNTEEEVKQYRKEHSEVPIILKTNRKHSGLGRGVKTGFEYAITNDFDYCILLRGDYQVTIQDFSVVFERRLYEKYSIINGARYLFGSKLEGYSPLRIMGSIELNLLYSIACKQRIFDLGFGIHFMKVEEIKKHSLQKYPDNNLFFSAFYLESKKYNQKIYFCPISAKEDGMVFPVKMLNQALFLIKWAFISIFSKEYSQGECFSYDKE